jgi:hypothetical protein
MRTTRFRRLATAWLIGSLALTTCWRCCSQFLWDSVIVGGFDTDRSGDASFPSGDRFSQARTAIASNLSATVFTAFPTLDLTNLVGIDVLVIGVGTGPLSVTAPLSTAEQAALLQFVKRGGAAVLFIDNDSASETLPAVNRSFVAPFGMGCGDTVGGLVSAEVPITASDPVTRGPFGQVSSVAQYYPGCITNLGPYGVSVATNPGGCAIALVRRDAICPGSGPVLVSSDISGFWDYDGLFPSNASLFLNAMRYCEQNPQHRLLRIQQAGTNVVLRWPVVFTDVILEGAVRLSGTTVWTSITNIPTVIGAENYLTNPISNNQLYRLRSPE